MIFIHGLNRGGRAVRSPADGETIEKQVRRLFEIGATKWLNSESINPRY
jgi:hypothetical protein